MCPRAWDLFLYRLRAAAGTTVLMKVMDSSGREGHVAEGALASGKERAYLLAALNDSPATNEVLLAALGIAGLFAKGVRALHVTQVDDSPDVAHRLSRSAGVELRVTRTRGPVAEKILEALRDPDIFGTVIGMRAFPSGPRPAGANALGVISGAQKPVVLVPPNPHNLSSEVPRRLLVPLDGSETASDAFLRLEQGFVPDEKRHINVLLTFNSLTPPMLDHHPHDIQAWGGEFLARYCPGEGRTLHCREGDPGNAVIDVAGQTDSDLIVLSFGGDIEVGHGAVIREVLSRAEIPVLVLPVA